jgi:hypothetical protein
MFHWGILQVFKFKDVCSIEVSVQVRMGYLSMQSFQSHNVPTTISDKIVFQKETHFVCESMKNSINSEIGVDADLRL